MEYKHRACIWPIIGLETRGSFPVESPVNKRRAHAQKGLIPLFNPVMPSTNLVLINNIILIQEIVDDIMVDHPALAMFPEICQNDAEKENLTPPISSFPPISHNFLHYQHLVSRTCQQVLQCTLAQLYLRPHHPYISSNNTLH